MVIPEITVCSNHFTYLLPTNTRTLKHFSFIYSSAILLFLLGILNLYIFQFSQDVSILFCTVIYLDCLHIWCFDYSKFLLTLLCFHLESFSFCLQNLFNIFISLVWVCRWQILTHFINLKYLYLIFIVQGYFC